MNPTAYLLLRLAVAVSMFTHGLVRLPKLAGFSAWMVGSFQKSMLPAAMVRPFSYALPVAEFSVGLLLLLGLWTRSASIAGSLVMLALLFGTGMIENWDAVPSQLLHVAFFVALLAFLEQNIFSLDHALHRRAGKQV